MALAIASAKQRETSNNDALGVFLLGLPLGSMSGGDVAPEVAELKGQVEAVRKASIKENCGGTSPPVAVATGPGNPAAAATPALTPLTGPVDVPFEIDNGTQIVDGVGRLVNGHLTGQAGLGAKAITVSGDMHGNDLAIEVDGAIVPPAAAGSGNYYCSAIATKSAAVGKVAIPMSAGCGTYRRQVTLYVDLPPAGASMVGSGGTS